MVRCVEVAVIPFLLALSLAGQLQIQGTGGQGLSVDANTGAARTTLYPNDVGSLGSYRTAAFSGLTAGLAANTPIFSFRWGDPTRVAALRYVKLRAVVVTGFTAAQEIAGDCIIARGFTASDSAGTALVFAASNNAKKRTGMGASLVTDARIAAAVTLTAGTRTLDGNPFLVSMAKTLAAAATVQDASFEVIYDATHSADHPTIFVQNEGFVCRNVIALGAGGTVRWAVEVAWDERTSWP
jgi:hypothetical protein